MIRRAILIGNNSGHSAPTVLKGVDKDLINYRNYLKSGIGGGWLTESEVVILHNCSKREILSTIRNCYADYSFVVFSGHGFINSNDNLTYICTSDGYLSEYDLKTRMSKQTLILDCCREISVMENFTGDVAQSFEKGGRTALASVYRTIINARQKFDLALANSSEGMFTGYACLTDQFSGDYPNSGGVFSSALITAGMQFGSKDNYNTWLPVRAAFKNAAKIMSSDPFSPQNPDYMTYPATMQLTHPFALTNKLQRIIW